VQTLFTMSVTSQITAQIERLTEQIRQDPGFAKWLVEEYKPIAGGWQY
jgi:hypothetical protein